MGNSCFLLWNTSFIVLLSLHISVIYCSYLYRLVGYICVPLVNIAGVNSQLLGLS